MHGVWYAGKEGEEFNERCALSISEEKHKNDRRKNTYQTSIG